MLTFGGSVFMKRMAQGLLLGLLVLPVALAIFLYTEGVPVAVADKPFQGEEQTAKTLLFLRLHGESKKKSPIDPDAFNLQAGMQIYRSQCASCHGIYEHPSAIGLHMYPQAPQLWKLHGDGVVGVSDDPVGETYWKIANGVRLTGMPAYKTVLSDTQIWQVSLLLANANKPLPYGVLELIKKPLPGEPLPVALTPPIADLPALPDLPKLPAAASTANQ
jgi:thiosulfate dehydrogenase